MKKRFFISVSLIMAVLFVTGCSTLHDQLSAPDISLDELEKRMDQATDPQGNFAKSKTYSMLQQVKTLGFLDGGKEYLVDVKFERPDKFCLITYEDNKPSVMWCSNGKQGWIADYNSRKVNTLDGGALRRMSVMAQISNPQESYAKIFPKVELYRCVNENGSFYRVDCFGADQNSPISIYIDSATYLVKKMKFDLPVGSGRLSYEADIEQYEMREGVMIPILTKINQNGERQECKITAYRLNIVIPETDFIPPVF